MKMLEEIDALTDKLQSQHERCIKKKTKLAQNKKIMAQKDRQILKKDEYIESHEERLEALKRERDQEIIKSNMKGQLLLELRDGIRFLKDEFEKQTEKMMDE